MTLTDIVERGQGELGALIFRHLMVPQLSPVTAGRASDALASNSLELRQRVQALSLIHI